MTIFDELASPDRDDRFDDEREPRPRYIKCADGFCGADDCPRCRPWNFRGGVYVGDIEEEEC